MEVGFYHGILPKSYEEQANEQGFTLGDKKDKFEEIRKSYNILHFCGYITDSQADKILRKIQKDLVKNLKVLKKDENTLMQEQRG